jgi:hypothetical protein
MGQTSGILAEILARMDHCELCGRPSDSENACDVYTIDKMDHGVPADLWTNILVLCPACKKRYDEGAFGKRHLKACVRLRDPGLNEWLQDLFEGYGIVPEPVAETRGLIDGAFHRMVNNPGFIDSAMFLSGIFIIFAGVILFFFGFNNVSYYDGHPALTATGDAVQGSPDYLFSMFLEIGGVVMALAGLFLELRLVKGNA